MSGRKKDDLDRRIGGFIRQKRLESNASIQQLVEALAPRLRRPINQGQLSQTERGNRALTFEEAIALSHIFGVRPQEIFDGAEPVADRGTARRSNPFL